MRFLLNLLLRVVLLAAGLVFAASLAVTFAILMTLWLLRAAWARLTGRPAAPFVMRMYPGDAFASMARRPAQASRGPRDHGVRPGREQPDVTDVEVRELR
jgi:hypothetical protein